MTSYRDFHHDDAGDDGSFAIQSVELELAYDRSKKDQRHSRLKKTALLFSSLTAIAIFGGWWYVSHEGGQSFDGSELAVKTVLGASQRPLRASSSALTSSSIRGADESTMMDDSPSKSESGRFQPGGNSGYLIWLEEHGSEYEDSIFQPSPAGGNAGDGVAIHWTIDDSSNKILLAVAARAEGWIGFGLAEAGGMRGADMVLFEYQGSRLFDMHVLSEPIPLEDDCQSWKLRRSHKTDDGYLIFEAERLLDTEDPQDRAIPTVDFPQRVIAAWGDSKKVTHHEPAKKVRSVIRFRGEPISPKYIDAKDTENDNDAIILSGAEAELAALEANEADIIVDIVVGEYLIPSNEKYEYAEFCFTSKQIQDLLLQKMTENQMNVDSINDLHLIALEPILDQEEYVHHISIAGSPDDKPWQSSCNIYNPGAEMIYIWDVGADPMILPKVAGIPFGKNAEGGGHMSLALEVHYNNPKQTSGLIDSSGFRLYFTTNKRQHDLGMMQVGDPQIGLLFMPVGEGLTKHKFDCPEACTREHLKDDIVVVQEGLHMHKTGARMVNRQLRNGEEVRFSSIEYNDFYMAGQYVPPQEPFVVKPSDTFETECYYENTDGENPKFGMSTTDEMCISFMWFYPRSAVVDPDTFNCGIPNQYLNTDMGSCVADYTKKTLVDRSHFGRTFGFRTNEDGAEDGGDASCK